MTSASLSQRGSCTASPTRAPLIPQLILNMAKNILRRTSGSHQSSRAKCVADFIVWSVVVWFLRMRDEKSAAGVEMRLKKKDIFLTTANKKHLTDPCHIMSSLVCLTCQTMTREKKESALGSRAEKDKPCVSPATIAAHSVAIGRKGRQLSIAPWPGNNCFQETGPLCSSTTELTPCLKSLSSLYPE